jgi:hypothetical protein
LNSAKTHACCFFLSSLVFILFLFGSQVVEEVHPVVEREREQTHVVKTTVPIKETVVEAPAVVPASEQSTVPAVMSSTSPAL